MTVGAVVVAAGAGTRYGGRKQFAMLAGRSVLAWAVEAASSVSGVVVVVVPPDAVGTDVAGAAAVVAGGETRSDSVRAGLRHLPEDVDVVVVHDAARPLAPPALFTAVVAAVRGGADGAVPGLRPADTVKVVAPDHVVAETLERDRLVAVQTPQAFSAGILRRALGRGGEATDDAALVEAGGGKVVVVPGDPRNIKLTTAADLIVAEALLGP